MDRATRASVIINALDARGLYTVGIDASEEAPPSDPTILATLMQYKNTSAMLEGAVLGEMADGTGGTFFHNSNDLDAGFKRVAARPEFYYVLGFSPQNLKLDGRFHALKVTLKEPAKLALQSRRGLLCADAPGGRGRRGQARDGRGAVLARRNARTAGRTAHAILQDRRNRREARRDGPRRSETAEVRESGRAERERVREWSQAFSIATANTSWPPRKSSPCASGMKRWRPGKRPGSR